VCSCERGDEPSDSIKGGEFFGQVSHYLILKKNPASEGWLVVSLD
jgi:hypothetical protein